MSNLYMFYKSIKKSIELAEGCCNQDHSADERLQEMHGLIKGMNLLEAGLAERYEREKAIIKSFTREQIDHICYQIGDWYLEVKGLLEGEHNLGFMKEKLKMMICGD